MKRALEVWRWSAAVLAHSRGWLVLLAAFLGLWALAAYEWLWIPESSAWVLMLSLVWVVAQVAATAAASAVTLASAMEVAATAAPALPLVFWRRLRREHFAACLLWLIAVAAVGREIAVIFGWVNQHSIELASFLTFHFQKPVSYLSVEKWFRVVEGLIWIALATSLLGFLLVLFRSGWHEARRQFGSIVLTGCLGTAFLSGFLSVLIFGGLAYLLANWRPAVPPGFWDYSQLAVRTALVLILVAAGWLFGLLCLARLSSDRLTAANKNA